MVTQLELVRKHGYGPLSVMGTNVKTNIFGTLPVTSANVNKKNIATNFLNMTRSTNIIMYSFSKILTVRDYSFLIKPIPFA